MREFNQFKTPSSYNLIFLKLPARCIIFQYSNNSYDILGGGERRKSLICFQFVVFSCHIAFLYEQNFHAE